MTKKDDNVLGGTSKKIEEVGLDDLQAKIKELEAQESAPTEEGTTPPFDQTEELKAALARALADLQNYKRRSGEDRGKFIKMANAELLLQLLPTFDNLHRSMEHLPDELKDNDWVKGLLQIHDELQKTLERVGVQRMTTVGQPLDPNRHEALMSGPGKKDEITEEFEPGYLYKGEVLKPAKVNVGDGSKK